MLAVIGIAVGGLLVLGFYGYVFLQLYREHQRFRSCEQRLHDHFLAIDSAAGNEPDRARTTVAAKILNSARKETLIQVGVALGGLLGVFAEIGLLNWVVG